MVDAREVRINLSAKGQSLPILIAGVPHGVQGELTDASRHGMFIKTESTFAPGQELDFNVVTQTFGSISGRMAVCWHRPGDQGIYLPKGIGVRVLRFFENTSRSWDLIVEQGIGAIDLRDLFTPNLIRVGLNDSVASALAVMQSLRQKTAIVLDGRGKLWGTLDFEDIINGISDPEILTTRVANLANPNPPKIELHCGIDAAFRTLKNQHQDFLLVLQNHEPVGMLTLSSVLPYWYEASLLKEDRLRANLHKTIDLIAHDMRNPTGIILASIQCLSSGLMSPEEFINDGMTGIIEHNCHNMIHLIDELLGSFLQDGSAGDLKREPFDVSELIKGCTQQFLPFAERKKIELTLHKWDPSLKAMVDRSRLERVLANLLSNAIKYSSAGDRVFVSCEAIDGLIRITIKDTGQGIPSQELSRVFDFYCKISSKPTAGESSTGLGMAISKKIIEAHGGRIYVASERGQGATFTVELPILVP